MYLGGAYRTSNSYIAYPFADDASGLIFDPDTPGSGILPVNIFLDAYVVVWDDIGYVYVSELQYVGSTLTITLADSEGIVLGYATVELTPDTAYYTAEIAAPLTTDLMQCRVYGRLLLSSAIVPFLQSHAHISAGTSLPLSRATMSVRLPKLLSLSICDDTSTCTPVSMPQGALTGQVILEAGYNTVLEPAMGAEPDSTGFLLDLTPGAGTGTVPCTDTTQEEFSDTIMHMLADESGGVSFVSNDDCYDIRRDPGSASIVISNVCTPCCDCDDFVAFGDYLQVLADKMQSVYDKLYAIHMGDGTSEDDTIDSGSGLNAAITYWNNYLRHGRSTDFAQSNDNIRVEGSLVMHRGTGQDDQTGALNLELRHYDPNRIIRVRVRLPGTDFSGDAGDRYQLGTDLVPIAFPADTWVVDVHLIEGVTMVYYRWDVRLGSNATLPESIAVELYYMVTHVRDGDTFVEDPGNWTALDASPLTIVVS